MTDDGLNGRGPRNTHGQKSASILARQSQRSRWIETSSSGHVEGTVTTVVGRNSELGDCGPASEASLMAAQGIAIHDGVLYVVDSGRSRIRVVVP